MATEFDLSPPEIPEPTFFDNVLRYGLFLGAIFQIICILSILLPSPKSPEPVRTYSLTFLPNLKKDDIPVLKGSEEPLLVIVVVDIL
ncbi:protein MANBAL [Scyliorhinus torazame]|uniref:protein MANBAL n=1 Tax=Scyliorhinus torazame TaxID=75743 RepID=UPI003B5933AC